MTQLAELQKKFQESVLNPGKPRTTAWISAAGRATPETQLSVYTHAYTARLVEVLASDYPAVLVAVGEGHFEQLAVDYIRAHPSRFYSLRDFGQYLPGFLAPHAGQPARYPDMPWLVELAVFEWTLGQAFDAADGASFSAQDMAAIPPHSWPELRFVVHPSVQRLDLEWNAPEIWRVLTADPPTHVEAERDNASPWLVWREQLVTRFRSLQNDEQQALDTARGGGSFDDLCEALAGLLNEDQVPLRAAALLKGWIAQGVISGIR